MNRRLVPRMAKGKTEIDEGLRRLLKASHLPAPHNAVQINMLLVDNQVAHLNRIETVRCVGESSPPAYRPAFAMVTGGVNGQPRPCVCLRDVYNPHELPPP